MKNLCTFIFVSCMIVFAYGAPAESDSNNGATNENCPSKGENNLPSCECIRQLSIEATTESSSSLTRGLGVDGLTNAVFIAALPGINCNEE